MLPIVWRYLLVRYIKYFFAFVSIFVAILLTLELEEIARFLSLGAGPLDVLLFTGYQIPYILPIAIPVSALIASLLLMYQLSLHHELIAFRSAGFSLYALFFPCLLLALLLSACNFVTVSEVATQAHFAAHRLRRELKTLNPLLVLNNKHFMKLQGSFFEIQGTSKAGELASHIVLAFPQKEHAWLNLMTAGLLKVTRHYLQEEEVTHVMPLSSSSLIVETIEKSKTPLRDFGEILENKVWKIELDYLSLPALWRSPLSRSLIFSEIFRRISLGFLPFSFTWLGLTFGMSFRRDLKRPFKAALLLSALYLILFFAAKSLHKHLFLSSFCYFFPHAVILFIAAWVLHKHNRGITL